jgi:hypothetical protein
VAIQASAGTAMSSKMISASGMPRNPIAGSRLPMMSPGPLAGMATIGKASTSDSDPCAAGR